MSGENVEIARRLFPGAVDVVEILGDPDVLGSVLEPLVHPDFETVADPQALGLLREPGVAGSSGVARGIAGFVSRYREWLSAWEAWVVTPIEIIEVDTNRVLVVVEMRARSRTHGVEIEMQGANLLTLREGRLARWELFLRRADAFEAIGPPQ